MPVKPKKSPWGRIKYCEEMFPGVYDVSANKHGGIMVNIHVADSVLSPAARKCGFKERGFICFEEDKQAAVVERELLDRGLWQVPPRFEDKADYEAMINGSLQKHNPEYWQARQRAVQGRAATLSDKPEKPSILNQTKENQELIKNQDGNPASANKNNVEL